MDEKVGKKKRIRKVYAFAIMGLFLALSIASPCSATPFGEGDTNMVVEDDPPGNDGYIYWEEDGAEFMRLTGDRLGIKDITPDFRLELATSSGNGYLGVSSAAGNDGDIFIIDTNGRLGIGDTSPDFKLEVTGSSGDGYFGISSTDDEEYNGDIFIIDDDGNVGIGTPSPRTKLEVFSNEPQLRLSYDSAILTDFYTNSDGNLNIRPTGEKVGIYVVPKNTLDVKNNMAVGESYAGIENAPDDGMIIEGRVGIGTPDPQALLGLYSGTTVDMRFQSSVTGTTTSDGLIVFLDGGKNGAFWNYEDADLRFGTNSAERVTIKNDGKVGIGTTGPINKLDIAGNVAIGATYSGSETGPDNGLIVEGQVGIGTPDTTAGVKLEIVDTTNQLRLTHTKSSVFTDVTTDSNGYFIINPSGNKVGIENLYPDRKLDILDSSNPQLRLTQTDDTIYTDFQTTNNGYLYINPSGGNVGIGDTSPDFKLEVTGSSGDGYFGISSTDDEGDNGDIFIIDDDGNVGIGTVAPLTSLHVKTSDVDNHIRVQRDGYNPYMDLLAGGSWVGIDCRNCAPELFTIYDDGTPRFHIDAVGKVGVGTTDPHQLLHIKSSTDHACVKIEGASDKSARMLLCGDRDWEIQNDGDGTLGTADYLHIYDYTAQASRLVIDTSGNVGIGTINPGGKLEVSHDGSAHDLVVATTGYVGIGTDGPQFRLDVDGDLRVDNGDIRSEGDIILIGGEIRDSGSASRIAMTQGGRLDLNDQNGDPLISIVTTGNSDDVGIGTIEPTSELDINGNEIRIRNQRNPGPHDAGFTGEICWSRDGDNGYIYVCVNGDGVGGDEDTWARVAVNHWTE